MRILNFGSCNIDYVYELSHIVMPGETVDSHVMNRYPGGKGLNQSIALARSGSEVYHAGCIGGDGIFLKETMEEAGVNTKYLKIEDFATGHAVIQVDSSGENCIIVHHGANYMIDKNYIDSVFENFEAGDILVLQNEISNLEYIINKGCEKNMKIVLNPSPFVNELAQMDLNKIYLLILNEVEALGFTGCKEPVKVREYIAEKYANLNVVLTLGSNGSFFLNKDTLKYCPIYKVDAVDTTAAGDTFTGYFVSGMIQGIGIKDSLRFASVASALAVSKMGAASSIPKKEETEAALKSLTPQKPVQFILGTDWWDDCDDAVAIRVLTRFCKANKAKLLGIAINACMPISARSMDAYLHSEGMGDIAIGIDLEATDFGGHPPYQKRLSEMPGNFRCNEDCLDGVELYRTLLAKAEEKVDIIEIGFSQILANLLKSKPDHISELTGAELVAQKVRKLWAMAGKWDDLEKGRENNFARNQRSITGANYLCDNWPTEITFLGQEVAESIITGGELDKNDILHKILADFGKPGGRSSWDPLLVYLACVNNEEKTGFKFVSGKASVEADTGINHFTIDKNGKHRFVIKKFADEVYEKTINDIIN